MSSEGQRPSMRRKSSAQNLLSSLKVAQLQQMSAVSSAAGFAYTASVPTPTATTPAAREWDVQSLHADNAATANGAAHPQGTTVEILRELVKKRIITLTYLRSVHEGRSHWFHTIVVTRGELDRAFSNAAMKSRTFRFASLGMSLANSFDVKDPQDFLRGLSNVLNEYDQAKEEGDRPKMRSIFRARPRGRQTGPTDFTISYTDPSETSYLVAPHVPFALDYHQTLLSLLDVLSEVYNKISKILGPSPFPAHGAHMMGPLGLLSPHPGVSYLFNGTGNGNGSGNGNGGGGGGEGESEGTLWGIANAAGAGALYGGALGSPPPSWNSALGDAVRQIDAKLKKLIAVLLKELDDFARIGIKEELASLDPLLRNVAVPDEAREFEFE